MSDAEKRARTYATKYFNEDNKWWPAVSGYVAGFNRATILQDGEVARLRKALDDIYNHSEAARVAVVEHYGTTHGAHRP